jgi:protein-tyrosine phosphatase
LIFWIQDRTQPQLAIVPRPRGAEWLRDELGLLRDEGIDVLVSLLSPYEAWALGLVDEEAIAGDLGMHFIAHPIPDREVPDDVPGFRQLVANLAVDVRAGRKIGVHCRACIGRSTVLLASLMIAMGSDPEEALRLIADARGMAVPDTLEQREWILQFRPGALISLS